MNLEKLSKPELLTLFSILEGELEARDLVIEALKVGFLSIRIRNKRDNSTAVSSAECLYPRWTSEVKIYYWINPFLISLIN